MIFKNFEELFGIDLFGEGTSLSHPARRAPITSIAG
jgi:hypothetical protein